MGIASWDCLDILCRLHLGNLSRTGSSRFSSLKALGKKSTKALIHQVAVCLAFMVCFRWRCVVATCCWTLKVQLRAKLARAPAHHFLRAVRSEDALRSKPGSRR